MNKKGQGLPLQTIIIAVILLIVLGVMVYIFTNKLGGATEEIGKCKAKGGECLESCGENQTAIGQYDCGKGKSCCYNVTLG